MLIKFLRKSKSAVFLIMALQRNFQQASKLKPIEIKKCPVEDIVLRGLAVEYLSSVKQLYKIIQDKKMPLWQVILYRFFGNRLVIVSLKNDELQGMELYYFNPRDVKEGTAHQGLTAVAEQHRGQGVATKIRKHAAAHFQKNGLSGLSSRVDLDNIPSLKSNIKLGFEPVEEYFCENTKKQRYYLKLNF